MLQQPYLVQIALTAAAFGVLIAVSTWARGASPDTPLTRERARELILARFPGRKVEAMWVAVDGRGAVARSGVMALVLYQQAGRPILRQMPWPMVLAATARDGLVRLELGEGSPPALLALDAWPPRSLAA